MTQRVLFDTNILIDALNGHEQAFTEIAHWPDPAISFITYIEIYAGVESEEARAELDLFMDIAGFTTIYPDEDIMKLTGKMMAERRAKNQKKVALPDMIIIATGKHTERVVVTRNRGDFKDNVRVPYELKTETVETVTVINYLPPTGSALDKRRSV